MDLALIERAIGVFAATNIDSLVVLALLFGRAVGDLRAEARIVARRGSWRASTWASS